MATAELGAVLRWLADRCDAGEVESLAVHWVHPENAPRPPWHPEDGTKTSAVQSWSRTGADVPECWNRELLYAQVTHAMSANYRRGERAGRANAGQPRKAGWSIDES